VFADQRSAGSAALALPLAFTRLNPIALDLLPLYLYYPPINLLLKPSSSANQI
jgi:hypothetical protein